MAEGGAGGREVGRISIRVVPNTENFRRDLQRQLDEIEDSTKAKIRIDPDLDGFREKVDAATKGLKDAKVKIKTEFDSQGKIIHDLDNLADDVGKGSKGVKLDVTPNIQQSSFQKALRDAQTQAKLADLKLDVDFKDAKAESRLLELIAKLKAEAKLSDIEVGVRVKRKGSERPEVGGGGFGRLLSGIRDGGAAAGGVGSSGLRLLTDQTALIAVAIVGLLAPALALFAQALVGLPALIAGVTLPIGVFALGLGGIKKALDDSGILKDDQAFDKHGKPKGKDKQGLGSALKDVQQQVSDVFEKGLTPVFRQIGGVIPQLLRGLPFVAQGMVSLAQSVTKAIITPQFISNFDRFTNSVGTMLTNMGPGLGSFTNAMSNLITNVGDHLPGLGNSMSQWAGQFGNWVDKISKPQQFWGKDTSNSSTLDKAVSNIKPTLDSIVHFVGELVEAGLKMAANPDMAKNIKETLTGIADFVTNTLPDLMEVFKQVASVAKALGLVQSKDKDKQENLDGTPKNSQGNGPVPSPTPSNPNPHGFDANGVPKSKNGVETDSGKFTPDLNGIKALLGLGKGGWWDTAVTGSSKWLDQLTAGGFTRPKTDHPVIVQQGGGQQNQQPQQTQQPKVDLSSVAQSIQSATGAIASAANAAFKALSDAATVAVSQSVQAVQQLPGAIAQALSGVYQAALAAGQSIGTGMAAGIAAGAPSAIAAARALAQGVENATKVQLGIHSPSKVFQGIGENTAQGYQDGLEGGFQGVLDSAKNLNQQLTSVFSGGAPGDIGAPGNPYAPDRMPSVSGARPSFITDLPGSKDGPGGGITVPTGFGSDLQSEVKDQLKAIKVEQDRLRAQAAGTTDKGQKKAIQGQIDQLNISKDQLKASASQLGYSQKYGDSQAGNLKQQEEQLSVQQDQLRAQKDQTTDKGKRAQLQQQIDQIQAQKDLLKLQDKGSDKAKNGKSLDDVLPEQLGKSLNGMVDIGKNFAMANVNQFENDIGISGKGAIPTIANIGLDWATNMLGGLVTNAVGGGGKGGQGDTHIHVLSMPEALEAQRTVDNRRAQTYMNAGR